MPHEKLTPAFVRDAQVPTKGRVTYWDTAMPSCGLMVTDKGARSFVRKYRNAQHIQRKKTWAARIDGSSTGLTLDQAKREAKKLAGDVEKGGDPVEENREERRRTEDERRKKDAAASNTLKARCEEFLVREGGMTRDADGNATFHGKLRSAEQRLKVFERCVYSEEISSRPFDEIKRSEFTKLLDKIEDERGARQAHVTGAYLSKVCSWYATRNDEYRSPFVRGTAARVKPKERAGNRVLADDEIRDVWTALDVPDVKDIPPCFARRVRTLFFTAV